MKVTTEYDNSKTWSGLPAPEGWMIVERRADGVRHTAVASREHRPPGEA